MEDNFNKEVEVVEGEAPFEIQKRYAELEADRSTYIDEAVKMAELTIPTLFPPPDSAPGYKFNTPYQGMGSRGVNNLSSKLLLTLLPSTTSFFRLEAGELELEKLGAKSKGEIEQGFAQIERAVNKVVETKGIRISIFEALKQLLVAGNVLLHMMPTNKLKVFRLDRYVVKRDTSGEVMEIITKETIDSRMLPKDVQEEVSKFATATEMKSLDLYTKSERQCDGKWEVCQELRGRILNTPSAKPGKYKDEEHPFIVLTFIRTTGEDYGRGFVEELKGDLYSLEGLSKAIIEGAAATARLIFLVRNGSTIDKRQLQDAENLAVMQGNAEDVTAVQSNKAGDLQVAFNTVEMLATRLGQAFLLSSSVQRNAERVSAEEIRLLAHELEAALGGIRSILSQELQVPLVHLILAALKRDGKVPAIPKEISLTITAGVEAYGRGQDVEALSQYLKIMFGTFGPEVASQDLILTEVHKRLLSGLGISPMGLIKDEQMKAQEQAQMQQAQEQAAMNDAAVRSAPNMVNAMANQEQQPQPTQ